MAKDSLKIFTVINLVGRPSLKSQSSRFIRPEVIAVGVILGAFATAVTRVGLRLESMPSEQASIKDPSKLVIRKSTKLSAGIVWHV